VNSTHGVASAHFTQIETGAIAQPPQEVIVKLGAGLGIDVQLLRPCAYPEVGALIGRLGRFSFAPALGSAESVAR
jgi:hypothetical protein